MPNYQNGRIYAIRSRQSVMVYIGSTTQTLSRRFHKHRSYKREYEAGKGKYVTAFQLLEFGDAYIELVEMYPCGTKEELCRREGEIMRETVNCVNKIDPTPWTRDDKLRYNRTYYNDNKVEILQGMKMYRDNNKVAISARKKLARDNNKVAIAARKKLARDNNKEMVNCGCGSVIRKYKLRDHEKTKKHKKYIETNQPAVV